MADTPKGFAQRRAPSVGKGTYDFPKERASRKKSKKKKAKQSLAHRRPLSEEFGETGY